MDELKPYFFLEKLGEKTYFKKIGTLVLIQVKVKCGKSWGTVPQHFPHLTSGVHGRGATFLGTPKKIQKNGQFSDPLALGWPARGLDPNFQA